MSRAGELDDLVDELTALARSCTGATPEQVASAVSLTATKVVPGAEQASVSLANRSQGIETLGSVGPTPQLADLAQVELREGPCVSAAWDESVVHLLDTGAARGPWPDFRARAAELGVGSMLSLQLSLDPEEADRDAERVGVINLYATDREAFGPEASRLGRVLVAHATVAMVGALRVRQLTEALESRDVIGQAKGLIMARHGMGEDDAFQVLVRRARDTNTRLRDVAADLVAGGPRPD